MEFYFEIRDDTEVATASAQGPKQVGVFSCARMHNRALGSHYCETFDVVARQTVQAGQPAESSTKNQTGSAGVRDYSRGKNKTVLLRGCIDRTEQTAAGEARVAGLRINQYLTHSREIDHQAAVASAEAGEAMASAAQGSQNASGRSGPDGILHILDVGATGYKSGGAGCHRVPNASRLDVALVTGTEQISAEPAIQ